MSIPQTRPLPVTTKPLPTQPSAATSSTASIQSLSPLSNEPAPAWTGSSDEPLPLRASQPTGLWLQVVDEPRPPLNTIGNVPEDAFQNVLSYLSPKEVARASKVSNGFRQAAADEPRTKLYRDIQPWLAPARAFNRAERRLQNLENSELCNLAVSLIIGWPFVAAAVAYAKIMVFVTRRPIERLRQDDQSRAAREAFIKGTGSFQNLELRVVDYLLGMEASAEPRDAVQLKDLCEAKLGPLPYLNSRELLEIIQRGQLPQYREGLLNQAIRVFACLGLPDKAPRGRSEVLDLYASQLDELAESLNLNGGFSRAVQFNSVTEADALKRYTETLTKALRHLPETENNPQARLAVELAIRATTDFGAQMELVDECLGSGRAPSRDYLSGLKGLDTDPSFDRVARALSRCRTPEEMLAVRESVISHAQLTFARKGMPAAPIDMEAFD